MSDIRRLRGDRGVATVTGLVLLFSFTAGAMIWLARDVNRSVSNRSAAQSIAFQAARAGAQQISLASVRSGDAPAIDQLADSAARSAAADLFKGYGVSGTVDSVTIDRDAVVVRLTISDPAGDVTGVASARAEAGP
jgi:hypothetical protein